MNVIKMDTVPRRDYATVTFQTFDWILVIYKSNTQNHLQPILSYLRVQIVWVYRPTRVNFES